MDQVNLIKTSYALIKRDFGLEGDLRFEEGQSGVNRLRELLVTRLNYLLDHDFNGLLNALYRIDIAEEQVNRILQQPTYSKISADLADVIIERQKRKAVTRLTYRQE